MSKRPEQKYDNKVFPIVLHLRSILIDEFNQAAEFNNKSNRNPRLMQIEDLMEQVLESWAASRRLARLPSPCPRGPVYKRRDKLDTEAQRKCRLS